MKVVAAEIIYSETTTWPMHMDIPLFTTPNGIIALPQQDVRQITDIDEELFLLYTLRDVAPQNVGLGIVDGRHDTLSVPLGAFPSSKCVPGPEQVTIHQNVCLY